MAVKKYLNLITSKNNFSFYKEKMFTNTNVNKLYLKNFTDMKRNRNTTANFLLRSRTLLTKTNTM